LVVLHLWIWSQSIGWDAGTAPKKLINLTEDAYVYEYELFFAR